MAVAFLLLAIQTLESWVVGNWERFRPLDEYSWERSRALDKAFLLSAIPTLEARRHWCDRKELDGLIDELRMIVDFLSDIEESRVSYLIGDLVEIVRDVLKLEDHYFFFCPEIGIARRWVVEAKMHMLQSGADGAEVENIIEGEDEDVVGLDEDVKLLLQKAISNDKQFRTFSITGMVGIGKTTLAKKLYNHADVVDQFELHAWVCVSSIFSHTEVLMKLIQQVVDHDQLQRMEKMEHAVNSKELQEMLHQRLKGMRYFIVLDDLQKEMHLQSIFKALPDEVKGSRLLLTSRSHNIGIIIHYHHLTKPLDSGQSWKLFVKTIFRGTSTGEHKLSKHLEEKGREMLKQCGGLPLAIKEVGRQLAEKRRSGREWEQILDESIDWDSILELVEPTYHKLDPDLKKYFLHLAFFKENTTPRTEKLLQIWAAGRILYFNSVGRLSRESIIEVEGKSCRINPILHRLSIKKAEEEIGFEILSSSGNINRPSLNPRHRVIICSRDKFNYSTSQDKHLISLFFHGGGYFDATPSYWESFEQLRILDLEDFGLKILPDSIGTLTELRYLGLRNNHIQKLPQSLGCLYNLEVLDIALNFMVEVPDIIWEMESLRHLYMSDVICQKPLKIGTLETLTYISFDDWTYELSGSQMMIGLKKLGIREVDENSNVSKLFASLAKLKCLDHLILRGCRFRSMPCLDELCILRGLSKLKLDGCLAMLPNLFSLKLINGCLDEDPMPVLEKLPLLRKLKLRNAYTGQQMVISRQGFPHLQYLCIEELWNLRNLQIGAVMMLETLEICNCPYLEILPKEIESMYPRKLRTVTTKNIAAKIQKWGFISQIRDVDINP